MREFTFIILFFIGSLLFASCSLIGETPDRDITADNIVFQTDQTKYIANIETTSPWPVYSFRVITQFKNVTNETLYLNRCYPDSSHPIYGVKLIDDVPSNQSAYDAFWACVGHDNPIAVKSGAIRRDTLDIKGPNSGSHGAKKGDGVLEGTYRLFYQIQSCRKIDGEGCTLPDSLSISNKFEVHLSED